MAFGLAGKRVLAIDWDARTLRAVLVRPRSDGMDLIKALSVPIPKEIRIDDAELLGAFIREALRQANIGARHALFCIPREQVVLNTLNLPPTPLDELPTLVQFQVVKELPFSAEQATLDFAMCGAFDAKAPSTVLVAALRNVQLSHYRKVATEAGLHLDRIGLRPHANLLAVRNTTEELGDRTLLLIEVGPQLTEINVIRNGVLEFSRAASATLGEAMAPFGDALKDSRIQSLAVQDRESDETVKSSVSQLMVEIVRSFEAYRATEPSVGLDHIVVCGSTGVEAELAQAMAARFATRADLYTPDPVLNLTPQRSRELRGFSAVLGLVVSHGERDIHQFNFLSPKRPVSRRSRRMRKVPAAVMTAVLLLGSAVGAHVRFIQPKQAAVESLTEECNQLKQRERAVVEFKKKVDALESWEKGEQYWPEVMLAIAEVFPPEEEAFVTRVDFETKSQRKSDERASSVRMRLRTAKLGTVHEVTQKLRDAGFGNVVPGKETPIGRDETGMYSVETSISAELPKRARVRTAAPEAVEAEIETDVKDAPAPDPEAVAVDSVEASDGGGTDVAMDAAAAPSPTGAPVNPPAASPGAATAADDASDAAEPLPAANAGAARESNATPAPVPARPDTGQHTTSPRARPAPKNRTVRPRRVKRSPRSNAPRRPAPNGGEARP